MKNNILKISVVATVLICAVILSQIVKNRGGVNVHSTEDYPVSEAIVYYRQDADSWKDINLGNSKFTMESSGCIKACIASAISESDNPLDPGELVTLLTENNVYDDNGNMQWGRLDELEGFEVEVYSAPDKAVIDECLAQNHYPIVKVHRKSLVSYHHFVLIVGSENGEYICMDPLKDGYTKLSDYGDRIYSVRCVWRE